MLHLSNITCDIVDWAQQILIPEIRATRFCFQLPVYLNSKLKLETSINGFLDIYIDYSLLLHTIMNDHYLTIPLRWYYGIPSTSKLLS